MYLYNEVHYEDTVNSRPIYQFSESDNTEKKLSTP